MITVQMKGFEGIEAALRQLPDKLQKKTINRALNKVAQMYVKAARAKCPVAAEEIIKNYTLQKPGNLKRSLGWGAGKKYKRIYTTTRLVGTSKGGKYDGWYGRLVELGHKSRRKGLDVRPHPFLQPAMIENFDRAQEILATELKLDLEKKLA